MTPIVMLTVAAATLTTRLGSRSTALQGLRQAVARRVPDLNTRRTLQLALLLAAFLGAGPLLSYLWLDAPDEAAIAPAVPARTAPATPSQRTEASPSTRDADVPAATDNSLARLADALAQRLHEHPADADGWRTLGHTHATLGRHAAAADAYQRALLLRPNDAQLLVDYAFSAAVLDPHGRKEDATRAVERALRIEPSHAKALALAGTLAVDRRDYDGAARYWERVAELEPADSPLARQVQASIAQARQLAWRQSLATATPAAAPADDWLASLQTPRGDRANLVRLGNAPERATASLALPGR
jgi:cytochrome c-type biogenesis protein CcmH